MSPWRQAWHNFRAMIATEIVSFALLRVAPWGDPAIDKLRLQFVQWLKTEARRA